LHAFYEFLDIGDQRRARCGVEARPVKRRIIRGAIETHVISHALGAEDHDLPWREYVAERRAGCIVGGGPEGYGAGRGVNCARLKYGDSQAVGYSEQPRVVRTAPKYVPVRCIEMENRLPGCSTDSGHRHPFGCQEAQGKDVAAV